MTRTLSVDRDQAAVDALRQRVGQDARAIVEYGDCNTDLIALMDTHVPRNAATFVLLDPEGYALDFTTVRDLAGFRTQPRKVELMTLVDTGSIFRTATVRDSNRGASRLDWAIPLDWPDIIERYRNKELSADETRQEIADGFCTKLRDLGYQHAIARPITRGPRDGAAVYHLAFASDHPAGESIMQSAFDRMHVNEPSGQSSQRPDDPLQGRLDL